MRRLQLGVLASVVPALLASLVLVGCGGKEEKGTDTKPPEGSKRGGAAAAMTKAIEGGTGTLKGKVVLEGAPPDTKKDTEALLTAIKAKADDKDFCLSSPEDQRIEQAWRIGDNKQVGNVFVWLEPAERSEFFKISDEQLKAVKEVDIDQPFCAFVPHCVILFPKYRDAKDPKKFKETGQKFVVKNDAKISHNTKLDAGSKNPPFNETLPPGATKQAPVFEPTNDEITIRCGIHPWMAAYARAFDHPYAALTFAADDPKSGKIDKASPKFGTYEIKNVPQGKVRVIAWHEKAGFLNGTRGEVIELKGGENTHDFKISAK